MTHKKQTLTINASDAIELWEYGQPPLLSELIDILVEAQKEGGTHIKCDKWICGDELESFYIIPYYEREETDEEFAERIAKYERQKKYAQREKAVRKIQREKEEYAEYLKLKAKFENQ